ncbi:MAG TPA: hypothetical protein VK615_15830 [Candidatus Binatia bacterium]|nr:hypothetical protein [Candidatus Binatia bacterium]
MLGLFLFASATEAGDTDMKFPSLTVDGQTYSNVVVFSKNDKHVTISHASGMASLKTKSLDTATLRKLGYAVAEEPTTALPPIIAGANDPRIRELQERVQKNVEEFLQQVDRKTLYEILALIGIIYMFFCYCCMQICRKTDNRAGLLVWVPGFQMIPLLRAAGMPWWLYFVPVVNFFAGIVWCFRICRVRQKSTFWAILLLFPVTSIIAFLYLALSGHPHDEGETETGRIKLGYQGTTSTFG